MAAPPYLGGTQTSFGHVCRFDCRQLTSLDTTACTPRFGSGLHYPCARCRFTLLCFTKRHIEVHRKVPIFHLSRPILAFDKTDHYHVAVAASRCLAVATVMMGIYGQAVDTSIATAAVSWMNPHTLFGVLLYETITARFMAEGRRPQSHSAATVYEFSRHLARLVYLLLYGLIGVAIAMTAAGEWWSIAGHQDSSMSGVPYLEAFQPYIAHGVASLLLIRIEALALFRHRQSLT